MGTSLWQTSDQLDPMMINPSSKDNTFSKISTVLWNDEDDKYVLANGEASFLKL